MDIDKHELNEPFTARVLALMESATNCLSNVLSKSSVDDETIIEIVGRLSVIESRELMFLICLQHQNIEEALKDVVVGDEIEFMEASEEYIETVAEILKEIE